MIGLALFGNWPLHQPDIDLAALQIAGYRSRLARRDHSAAAQASSVKTERLLALIAVVVVDCSISGVCLEVPSWPRAGGRQCPSFPLFGILPAAIRLVRPERFCHHRAA
jgi:hypothetical protein